MIFIQQQADAFTLMHTDIFFFYAISIYLGCLFCSAAILQYLTLNTRVIFIDRPTNTQVNDEKKVNVCTQNTCSVITLANNNNIFH